QSETVKRLSPRNRNVLGTDESLLSDSLTESINRHSRKLGRLFPFPLPPVRRSQECIQRRSVALRFNVLRYVPSNAEAVLNRDQQIDAAVLRELEHGLHGHL